MFTCSRFQTDKLNCLYCLMSEGGIRQSHFQNRIKYLVETVDYRLCCAAIVFLTVCFTVYLFLHIGIRINSVQCKLMM